MSNDNRESLDKADRLPWEVEEEQLQLCKTFVEIYHAYKSVTEDGDVDYEAFLTNYFAFYKSILDISYRIAKELCRQHRPIVEYYFTLSLFTVETAEKMICEMDWSEQCHNRVSLDSQLKFVEQVLSDEIVGIVTRCFNSIPIFVYRMRDDDTRAILKGESKIDYGIYSVSYFCYALYRLEQAGVAIRYWQALVWRFSRVVYKGKYVTQAQLSSTLGYITAHKPRSSVYREIDLMLKGLEEKRRNL